MGSWRGALAAVGDVLSAPCPGCSVSDGGSGRSVLPAELLVAVKCQAAGQSSTWQIYLPELQGARELVGCSQRCDTGTVATSRCHHQQQFCTALQSWGHPEGDLRGLQTPPALEEPSRCHFSSP